MRIPHRNSYHHRGGAIPLLGQTIDERFRAVVDAHPDNEAIVSVAQKSRLTYTALDTAVERLARGLLALGTRRGDRLGIWSTDNTEWVVLQLATARVGAILVNVNPAYRVAELGHALRLARVQTLFMIPSFRGSDYIAMLTELGTDALPELENVVVFDPDDPANRPPRATGWRSWEEVLTLGSTVTGDDVEQRAGSLDPDDPINIQFTSGTTGSPKAVVLSHHNILNNGYFVADAMGFTERDRLCVPVPFYHCFGMVVSNLACLSHGAALVIPSPHFEAGATLRAIESERCTAVHGVPTMFIAELEAMNEKHYDTSSLRTGIIAGAPCPPELIHEIIDKLGCREILIAYGQTEASPVSHLTAPGDSVARRVETVGTNLPHQETKLVDPESGDLVALGTPGEICFRGYHVMHGYYSDQEATDRAIDRNGWLHSGDLGVMDESGYLRITGRLSDMIIRGGENIYPAEIEACLFEHPKVAELSVFGVPDARYGEEVAAWVKVKDGESLSSEDLSAWAKERISHFKVPRHIWFVDEFPMTVTGKVQKFRMRQTSIRWLGEDKSR